MKSREGNPGKVMRPRNTPDPHAIETSHQRTVPGMIHLESWQDAAGRATDMVDHGRRIAKQDHV